MIVKFNCGCGHTFRTHAENAGKKIVCPNCLKPSVVPTNDPPPASSGSASAGAPRAASVPSSRHRARTTDLNWKEPSEKKEPSSPQKAKVKRDDVSPSSKSERGERTPVKPKSKSAAKPRVNNSENPFDLSGLESMEASDEIEVEEEFDEDFDDEPVSKKKKNKKKKSSDDEDDGKEKGKKGKPKRDSSSNLPLVLAGAGAGLVLMIVIAIFALPALITSIKEGGKIHLPDEYESFANTDIYFRCDVPKGWEVDSKGGSGNIPPSVKIEHGRVKILYRSSPSGAAIQDMSQAGANPNEEVDELKPVYKVHMYQYKKFQSETPDHKESDKPEIIKTGWGEGCLSEFTSTANFGKRVFGYRATLLTTQYQWNVTCTCPTKREFEAFKPVFRKIILSTGM